MAMGYLRSRVAYLQGLMEGFELEAGSREGRMLSEIVEVLGELVDAVEEVDEKVEALAEFVDDVDDDLTELESELYDPAADGAAAIGAEDLDDEAVSVLCCPDCGQPLAAEAGDAGGRDGLNIVCPGCGTLLLAPEDHQAEGPRAEA